MRIQASMNFKIIFKLVPIAIITFFFSCSGSEYSQLVRREMAKGVIHDSLLFDLKFGQHKQDFFRSCWQLNQKGLVSQGPGSKSVKYELPIDADAPLATSITLLFFGDFNEENIMTGMDLEFYYNAWSLWNKSLQSDMLLPVVMDSLKKWYPGNDFIRVPLKNDSLEIYVKVDGNRRITIKPIDHEKTIKAKIDDLRYVLERD